MAKNIVVGYPTMTSINLVEADTAVTEKDIQFSELQWARSGKMF